MPVIARHFLQCLDGNHTLPLGALHAAHLVTGAQGAHQAKTDNTQNHQPDNNGDADAQVFGVGGLFYRRGGRRGLGFIHLRPASRAVGICAGVLCTAVRTGHLRHRFRRRAVGPNHLARLAAQALFDIPAALRTDGSKRRVARPAKRTVNIGALFGDFNLGLVLDQFRVLPLLELHIAGLWRPTGDAGLLSARIFCLAFWTGPFEFNITKGFLCHRMLSFAYHKQLTPRPGEKYRPAACAGARL